MTKEFRLENATFHGISQKEFHHNFTISFTLDSFSYEFDIFYDGELDRIFLSEIFHNYNWKEEKGCPYCQGSSVSCLVLAYFKEEIFQKLIHRPEIRLKWVMRKHATIEI